MLSATTRALDRIQLDEDIQMRLGKVKEKIQRAEQQKLEELHKKIGQMTSLTAKVPEALQKKNAVQEEAYFKRLEKNIQKR